VSVATTRWAPSRINHNYLTNLSCDSLPISISPSLSHASSPLRSRVACWSSCAAYSSCGWWAWPSKVMRGWMHGGFIAPATACGCGEETAMTSQRNGERMWQISCGIVELMKWIPAPSKRLESYIFWSNGNGGSRHGAWMLLVATVGWWSCGGEWIDEAKEENLKEADGKEKRLLLQSVVVNRRLKSSIQWVMWWWMEVSQSNKSANETVKASRDVVLLFGYWMTWLKDMLEN
jgi:hypothetical protein